MKYGYFDNENKEYVITNPKTPTPWMNYIGNGEFGGIVSATGGGLTWINVNKVDRKMQRNIKYS